MLITFHNYIIISVSKNSTNCTHVHCSRALPGIYSIPALQLKVDNNLLKHKMPTWQSAYAYELLPVQNYYTLAITAKLCLQPYKSSPFFPNCFISISCSSMFNLTTVENYTFLSSKEFNVARGVYWNVVIERYQMNWETNVNAKSDFAYASSFVRIEVWI